MKPIIIKNPANILYSTGVEAICLYFFDPSIPKAIEYKVSDISKLCFFETSSKDFAKKVVAKTRKKVFELHFSDFPTFNDFFKLAQRFLPENLIVEKTTTDGTTSTVSDLPTLLDFYHFLDFSNSTFYQELLDQ